MVGLLFMGRQRRNGAMDLVNRCSGANPEDARSLK
jgi:hypothetical protein